MRVDKTRSSSVAGARKAGRTGGAGFSLPQSSSTDKTETLAPATGGAGVGSIDAILALQTVSPVGERRQRAARRGRRLLDALERLKIGLLEGRVESAHISLLKSVLNDVREDTEDPGLEAILNEIELRAQVELTKAQMAR